MPETPSDDPQTTGGSPVSGGGVPEDLKGRSVRGGAITLVSQALRFALQVGSTMVLARLLLPRDFGLVAMVTAVTGFVVMLKDMGLQMATVQRAEIHHRQVSTLFWTNVTLSTLALALVAALAPAIAWFYGEPRLAPIALALSGAFLFTGLAVQHRALLLREMRFVAIAVVDIVSMLVGVAAGIVAALLLPEEAGYWSLVAMNLATALAFMVVTWAVHPWMPGPPVRGSGVRPLLAFGRDLTAFNVLVYLARNLDNILIGRALGGQVLGFYSKAYNLLLLPVYQINQPVTSVAIPALSRLQHDPPRYRRYYRKGLLLITALGMPAIVFLFVAADTVILTVLGDQWGRAVPLFRALGPAAFLGTFNVAAGWVYLSLGQTRRQLHWQVVGSAVTILGFAVGLRWGVLGVALAYSITTCALRTPALLYCFRTAPVTMGDLVRAIWRPATASLAAGALTALADRLAAPDLSMVTGLVLEAVLFALLYLAAWYLLPQGREATREVLELVRELRPRPRETGSEAGETPWRAGE